MVIPHYAANMVRIDSDTNMYLHSRLNNVVGVILSRVVVVFSSKLPGRAQD